jgi:hypothetical protein
MRRLVLALLVLSLGARADQLRLGPEQRTALPDDGPAILMQSRPAVASDGKNFMIVWLDDRYRDLVAVRVDGSGALLDREPIRIPLRGYPSITWSGSEYVVVSAGVNATEMIHVGRDGTILGQPRVLANHPALVAFSRDAVLVVKADFYELSEVTAQTFDLRGEALGPVASLTRPRPGFTIALGSDGERFGIALTAPDSEPAKQGLWFAALSRRGAVSSFRRISEDVPYEALGVVGAAGRFTVAWWARGSVRVQVVDGGQTAVPFSERPRFGSALAIGGDLLVPIGSNGDALLLRIRSGAAPEVLLVANTSIYEQPPAVASNGTKVLLVWEDAVDVVYDLTGMNVKRADPAVRGRDITHSASIQQLARGAMAGPVTLLAWNEERDPSLLSIYAGRIGEEGELLDGRGLLLSGDVPYDSQPQVAFDGSVFVVAWREQERLAGTRITPAGTVLDAQPFTIAEGKVTDVVLASDGAGRTAAAYVLDEELSMRVIGSDGTLTPILLQRAGLRVMAHPSAVFDGEAFLVAWTEYERNPDTCTGFRCPPPFLSSDIVAARVADRVLQLAPLYTSAGRFDFYGEPRLLRTNGGTAIGYHHTSRAPVDQLLFARIEGPLTVSPSRLFGDSIYYPDISVIGGTPVVAWFDNFTELRVVPLNDDLVRTPGTSFTPGHLWYWTGTLVPGEAFGRLLYSERTAVDGEYAGAPRTFMRKITFDERRGRALRR